MRKRYAGLLVCVSVAVLLASWTGDAAAKSIDDDASVVENSSSTSTSASSLDFQHLHRGRTSLVSHWLDSTLGSSEGIILSSRLHKHKRHGNSSRPSGGGGSGKRSDDDHKPLLPLNARDLLGLFAASIAILLASGSGIGGGGLLVPIFLLIFGFGTRDSVALSNLTILGGSAVSLFFFNLARRHPRHRDRPLIDWDIILVMEPSTICGAVAGGYLNKITPTWLTTTLLALVLTAMALKLVQRARSVWGVEGEGRRAARAAAEQGRLTAPGRLSAALLEENGASSEEPLLPPKPAGAAANGGGGDEERASSPPLPDQAGNGSETPSHSPFSEHRLAPPQKVALIFALTLFVLAADLCKQFVECGSLRYWLVVASVLPPSLAVALFARARLVREHALRESASNPEWPPYEAGEVVWTETNSVLFPAISTLAGVVAGFFGVGGGIVKGPLMLEMGVAPEVAAATSITMIFFTSSAASVLFISFGIPSDYGKAVFATGVVFTALGQSLVSRLIKKVGKGRGSSIVVVLMSAMMVASAAVVVFEAGELTRRAVASRNLGGHGHIC